MVIRESFQGGGNASAAVDVAPELNHYRLLRASSSLIFASKQDTAAANTMNTIIIVFMIYKTFSMCLI